MMRYLLSVVHVIVIIANMADGSYLTALWATSSCIWMNAFYKAEK